MTFLVNAINSNQLLSPTDSPTFGGVTINNSSGSGLTMSGVLPVYSSTNTGNNAQGVRFQTHKNRAGAAAQAGDITAQWQAYFTNSALTDFESAHIQFYALGVNAGSEASQIAFDTTVSGTLANRLLLDSKLTSQVDIDFNAANHAIGASLGANTLTIAGTSSTTYIQGITNIASYLTIQGDFFPTTTSQSVSTSSVTNVCSGSTTSVEKDIGMTFGDLGSGQGYGFTFTKTGLYEISYNVCYRPASTAVGISFTATSCEMYFTQNNGSDTGDRFAYCSALWQAAGTFPTSLKACDVIPINDTTKKYRFVTFQNTGSTQILGMSATNRQRSSFCIRRISDL